MSICVVCGEKANQPKYGGPCAVCGAATCPKHTYFYDWATGKEIIE